MIVRRTLGALTLVLATSAVANAQPRLDRREDPPKGWFGGGEAGVAFLTAPFDGSPESISGAFGVRGGYRAGGWGVFLQLEETFWQTEEQGGLHVQVATDIALGFESFHRNRASRTAFAAGVSILTRENFIDEAGTTGIFLDFRPIGLRWRLNDRLTLVLDPLHLALILPVLNGIPLVEIQFRSTLGIDFM